MNKQQARILVANARALQLLPYRDNAEFADDANLLLSAITRVFDQLSIKQPELLMALVLFHESLRKAIESLPTHDHLTTPDPIRMRSETCNAIVEIAKLVDE